MFASETSWRRLQDMSSRRLQDMSSRRLQDMSSRRLQDISSRRLQDMSSRRLGRRKIVTLKTCGRRLQDMCWRRLEDQQMFAGIISTFFLLLSSVWPDSFTLKLNESITLAALKSTISRSSFTAGLPLQYGHDPGHVSQ